jgi:FMN-dependent NADH-azoreductase
MTVLLIEASARPLNTEKASHSSLSRTLAREFIKKLDEYSSDEEIIYRDVGESPPAFISHEWIDAVFTPENKRTAQQKQLLSQSDTLIDELARADLIVISTPMYNYGMPAALKAWFDQVVRVNKTFTFDLSRGDFPLEPTLSGKTMVLITSAGEFGFSPGGIREEMNHLGTHIKVLSKYLGVQNFYEVNSEYQEFNDTRHQKSYSDALRKINFLARELADGNHDTTQTEKRFETIGQQA